MEKYSIFADKRIKKVYTKEELEKMDKDEIRFVAGAKVEKSIHDIFYIDGSLLSIWHCVNRKVDFNVETFGYNMKQYPGVFCFNPYLIMMSTTEFLTYIMVSQGLKLLLRHPTYRILSDKPRHAVASNLAINSLLPANIIDPVKNIENFVLPEMFGFESKLSLEEYYVLIEDNKKAQQQCSKMGKSGGSGDKKEQKQGEGEDGEASQGEGQGENPFENSDDAMSKGMGALDNKDWSENDLMDADIKDAVNRNKNKSNSWGSITGSILDVILAAHESPINWRRVTRHFGKTVEAKKARPTRTRWNRRTGFVDPGYKREWTSKVLVAVDTSGSVGDQAIAEAFSVIKDSCKHSKIDYCVWDTEIKFVQENINKKMKHRNDFTVAGRGGTDVQCVLDYADAHIYDGVVIITDGYFSSPSAPKRGKTKYLWLMEKGNYNSSIADIIPCGQAYEMEKDGKRIA